MCMKEINDTEKINVSQMCGDLTIYLNGILNSNVITNLFFLF